MAEGTSADFDFLLGTWNVHNRRLREVLVGSDDWVEFPARLEGGIKLLNDLAIVDRFIAELDGAPFEGASLRIFHPDTKQWTIYWMDTHSLAPTPQVVGSFTDGVGVFLGTETFRCEVQQLRFTWSEITATSARWEQAYFDDERGEWEPNWIMEFTRVE